MIRSEAVVNKYLYDTDEVNEIIEYIENNGFYHPDNCTQEKIGELVGKLDKFISDINVVQEDSVVERKETEEEAREYFGDEFIEQLNIWFTDLDKQKTMIAIHGTSPDLCPSICEEGLRYKSPNLDSTAVLQHMEYGQRDMNVSNFSELLNWPHREYKGLVVIAVPYESFYREGLWNHYQNENNGYSYDYKINPDFIAGYIDVENKKIVRNPNYTRKHDYSGLVEDFDLYRQQDDMDNDKIVEAIIESEKSFESLEQSREEVVEKDDSEREVDLQDIPYRIDELIGTFNSIKLGFPEGMSEDRYQSLLEELKYKLDLLKKGMPLLKTEEEVERSRQEMNDMFKDSAGAEDADFDFDAEWDDPSLWTDWDVSDTDDGIKKMF